MKFFLVIVLVFVVLTVHGRDLPDDYGGLNPSETESPHPAMPDFETTVNDVYSFYSSQASGDMGLRKAGSKCQAQDICIVMGGTCINNASLCHGRLVPGCKGKNCKCCIYGNLEIMINSLIKANLNLNEEFENLKDDFKMELNDLEDNITNTNSKISKDTQSLSDNLSEFESNIGSRLDSLMKDTSNTGSKLDSLMNDTSNTGSKLDSLMKDTGSKLDSLLNDTSNTWSKLDSLINDTASTGSKMVSLMKDTSSTGTKLDSLIKDTSNTGSKLDSLMKDTSSTGSKLDSLMKDTSNSGSKLDSLMKETSNMGPKLDTIMRGCPAGFFQTQGSSQCYQFLNDGLGTWEQTKQKCEHRGLVVAEPSNPLLLRRYITAKYASSSHRYTWLGGRGTGSYIRWERRGTELLKTDTLWANGQPGGVAINHCLLLLAEKGWMAREAGHAYHMWPCSHPHGYALCEYVKN